MVPCREWLVCFRVVCPLVYPKNRPMQGMACLFLCSLSPGVSWEGSQGRLVCFTRSVFWCSKKSTQGGLLQPFSSFSHSLLSSMLSLGKNKIHSFIHSFIHIGMSGPSLLHLERTVASQLHCTVQKQAKTHCVVDHVIQWCPLYFAPPPKLGATQLKAVKLRTCGHWC